MIYYNNRYLSHKLGINHSKWKRWVREFLPADPLGGRQSGYARQLSLRDGFKVYLAGFLVSELKFAIPEAQMILSDLSTWLRQHGFSSLQPPGPLERRNGDGRYLIYIFCHSKDRFSYSIRDAAEAGCRTKDNPGGKGRPEEFESALIGTDRDGLLTGELPAARVVAVTVLYKRFCDAVQNHDE